MANYRLCKKCSRSKPLVDFPFYDPKLGRRRHECRVCHNQRMNAHYLKFYDYRLKRAKERYAAKPADWWEKRRERFRERGNRYSAEWRRIVFDHYGWQCACCGEDEPKFMTIDHVNNDGAEHRKQIKKEGVTLYRWLSRNGFPEDFRTLCYNCNCGRARNGGICPHKSHGRFIDYPAREYAASDRQRKRPALFCEEVMK